VIRVRDRGAVRGREQGWLGGPRHVEAACLRPRADVACARDAADAPVVRPVGDEELERGPRVLRVDELDRRVEARVGRQLELVAVGAGDGIPLERRQLAHRHAVDRTRDDRGNQRARRGNRDDEREREERGESEALFHGHVGGEPRIAPCVPCAPCASSGRGIERPGLTFQPWT
jgi:hypothetical protein